jgi:hypothetical protein
MDDDHTDREALAAAGYTGRRAAVLFCGLLAAIGALTGSVLFAILWNIAVPEHQHLATPVGVAAGGILGILIGLIKIRLGNREAREEVEDKEWRRNMLRHFGR